MDYDSQINDLKVKNLRTEDTAAYQRVHKWIASQCGKAKECSLNETHASTRYHWSNISGNYKYDTSDWRQLCPSCHGKVDYTDQHRQIASLRAIGNSNAAKQVVCLDLNTSYRSARDAARSVGILFTSLNNCLNGKTKTAGKLRWQYRGI